MSNDLTKKAVEILLKGGTLLKEPCPYCKGVRVMKDGHALCVNCGREPETRKKSKHDSKTKNYQKETKSTASLKALEQKLEKLTKQLEKEENHEKQQKILKSINSLVEIIDKLKK